MEIKIERNINDYCESCMNDDEVDLINVVHGDGKLEDKKLCRMCQEQLMLKLLDNISTIEKRK